MKIRDNIIAWSSTQTEALEAVKDEVDPYAYQNLQRMMKEYKAHRNIVDLDSGTINSLSNNS